MVEWFKAQHWKCCELRKGLRGFESLPLRQSSFEPRENEDCRVVTKPAGCGEDGRRVCAAQTSTRQAGNEAVLLRLHPPK